MGARPVPPATSTSVSSMAAETGAANMGGRDSGGDVMLSCTSSNSAGGVKTARVIETAGGVRIAGNVETAGGVGTAGNPRTAAGTTTAILETTKGTPLRG